MRGCCTITTRMRLASAASTAADFPPQPITSSGQGGASAAAPIAANGRGQNAAGTRPHTPRARNTRVSGESPAASASPSACVRRPA